MSTHFLRLQIKIDNNAYKRIKNKQDFKKKQIVKDILLEDSYIFLLLKNKYLKKLI